MAGGGYHPNFGSTQTEQTGRSKAQPIGIVTVGANTALQRIANTSAQPESCVIGEGHRAVLRLQRARPARDGEQAVERPPPVAPPVERLRVRVRARARARVCGFGLPNLNPNANPSPTVALALTLT